MRTFLTFLRNEDGATAIEYGLIASVIFLACLAAFYQFGNNTAAMWANLSTHLSATP